MDALEIAAHTLAHGKRFPYDAPDRWWLGNAESGPPSDDWAHDAARGVLADLTDRAGIKHQFEGLEEEIRIDIVQSLAAIIRLAASHSAEGE